MDADLPDVPATPEVDAAADIGAQTGEIVRDDPTSSARALAGRLDQALRNLTRVGVDDVFAAPTRVGDRVIITAANVRRQGGFGFGAGLGGPDGEGLSVGGAGGGPAGGPVGGSSGDTSTSGGGGGGADARPVAVISVDEAGVHVKPILDMTKIGLTLLTAGLTIWRTLRKS
jgi:uncharacterized spore protein YtfJ